MHTPDKLDKTLPLGYILNSIKLNLIMEVQCFIIQKVQSNLLIIESQLQGKLQIFKKEDDWLIWCVFLNSKYDDFYRHA